jgi:hypothetical protein
MPTEGLLNGVGSDRRLSGGLYRGGPAWPWFRLRVLSRTCRGILPFPRDVRPSRWDGPADRQSVGIWCGPVSPHFGHMVADFAMRIAAAAQRHSDLPLVFSMWPTPDEEPPAFFWALLDHLGARRERVILVRRPTRFDTLHVYPQAERLFGRGPSESHLDLMDRVAAARGPADRDIACLFVSRSRLPDGRLAGEDYIDGVLAAAGATVMHPEDLDLTEQLQLYRRARSMIFSEGSAVHGLQLLGRLDAEVTVLVRRPGARIASASLRPRLAALRYENVTAGPIHGRGPTGRIQRDRSLMLIDTARLLALFDRLGIPARTHWDETRYRARRDADIGRFIHYLGLLALHPKTPQTVAACLARHGISLEMASGEAAQHTAASPG